MTSAPISGRRVLPAARGLPSKCARAAGGHEGRADLRIRPLRDGSRRGMKIRKAVKTTAPYAERRQPARLPAGIAAVLSVLSSSAVVIDSEDHVLRASSAARSFGLVKEARLMVGELLALARQLRRHGEIREGEIKRSGTKLS